MQIIGLSGTKRSGKDTVCRLMQEITRKGRLKREAFADNLKFQALKVQSSNLRFCTFCCCPRFCLLDIQLLTRHFCKGTSYLKRCVHTRQCAACDASIICVHPGPGSVRFSCNGA